MIRTLAVHLIRSNKIRTACGLHHNPQTMRVSMLHADVSCKQCMRSKYFIRNDTLPKWKREIGTWALVKRGDGSLWIIDISGILVAQINPDLQDPRQWGETVVRLINERLGKG